MSHVTKNGAKCIPTGKYFYSDGSRTVEEEADYVEVQMLPAHPQRFERVRKSNLSKEKSNGR